MLSVVVVLCSLLAAGGFLVVYGTIARNKWGVNLRAVHCPRCGALLPGLGERRSLSQSMWGGCTCPACGAWVDKWGREAVPGAARAGGVPRREMRSTLRKKLIFIALLGFCLLLLLDWTGVTGRGFPSNWSEALIQVCVNVGWTVFFTTVSYFVMIRPLRRPSSGGDDHRPAHGLDRQQGSSDPRPNPKTLSALNSGAPSSQVSRVRLRFWIS